MRPLPQIEFANAVDAKAILTDLAAKMRGGSIVPYLGPGLAELFQPKAPMTPEALAASFASKVAVPRRAKGNARASAQYVESNKHRSIVTALMAQAFSLSTDPTPLHHHLATLALPLIVASWYDGAMRAALGNRSEWGEVQGITCSGRLRGSLVPLLRFGGPCG